MLTIGGAYYAPDASNFSRTIADGTQIYAQVESAHAGTDHAKICMPGAGHPNGYLTLPT